jgi:hypothetical protein
MNDRTCQILIHNVPNHARGYIVARLSNNALWYWGCWDDEKEAEECASTIGGIVVKGW